MSNQTFSIENVIKNDKLRHDKKIIVALGMTVIEVSEIEFNKLAILKNKVELVEKAERENRQFTDVMWENAHDEYMKYFNELIESKEVITRFEKMFTG